MAEAVLTDDRRQRARRAMELGRLRMALGSAALVTVVLGLIALALPSDDDLRLLALPFLAWTFVSIRGGALARGGLAGLLGAVAGWIVPMSILRPCCSAGAMQAMQAGADCCTRPECCLETGALLGVLVAIVVSLMPARGVDVRTQMLGAILVGASALGVRCSSLFLGESLGLVGGLALGAMLAGGARMLILRPSAA
jgi:hypothetical protein